MAFDSNRTEITPGAASRYVLLNPRLICQHEFAMSTSSTRSGRLTLKQESFARIFIVTHGNATTDYRRAYSADSMSQRAIEVRGIAPA